MDRKVSWSKRQAETIMKRYPDASSFPTQAWGYPQGFMLWGFIKLGELTGEERYSDYALAYADKHVDCNGNITGFSGNSLDDIMTGSVLVWAYSKTNDIKYKQVCDKIRKVFDTYPRTAFGGFWHADWAPGEMWVDGLFMGQMFLSKYGKYIGDSEYCFGETARQLRLIFEKCRKGDTGLLFHGWSENNAAKWADADTGCAPEVWSEGLGWYAMILVEVLEIFPEDHPEKAVIENQLLLLLKSLKENQDKQNGLWYQVVDKGHLADNWNDTSGSAMFVYTIQKAILLGYVDENAYGECVKKGYEGIISKAKVNKDGLVDIYDACDGLGIQEDYEHYIKYDRVLNAKEAVGAFLWATALVENS